MSIESDLNRIASALELIAKTLTDKASDAKKQQPENHRALDGTLVTSAPVAITAPAAQVVTPNPAPMVQVPQMVMPAPVPAAPAAPVPAPMVSAPVVAAVASPSSPFTDAKGLLAYVMEAYKALGPIKGGQIQGVLTALGYNNINEVKPEHYAALHQGVEALKG